MEPMQSACGSSADEPSQQLVEAARYTLLRRIAFSLRHEIVVHLQPIGMISEVLDRRLRSGEPDLSQLQDGITRINRFSKAAAQSCRDVVAWLAPEPGQSVRIDEGVRETLELLRSGLSFRGFSLRDELGNVPAQVARAGLRHTLVASLLLLTDSAGPPAEITVTVEAGAQVQLRLDLHPSDGPEGVSVEQPYRMLREGEVRALAQADGIGFSHEGDSIVLTLPQVSTAAE